MSIPMSIRFICLLTIFIFNGCFSLSAEIQSVVIKWNAALCLDVCIPGIERNLQSIQSVTDIRINARAGIAEMGWKPNYPFSFAPFNLATRSVGIRLSDLRLRVQGTIAHDVEGVYLVSLGDNTRFRLIGPIQPLAGRYVVQSNIASHPMPADLQQKLLDAEAQNTIVTVEGPLFEPFRYTNTIISEQVKFPKKDERDQDPGQRRYMR